MNKLYKSLFIEKILKFMCFIEYRNNIYIFKKPFILNKNSELPSLQSPIINLIDCTSNEPFQMHFDDITGFHTQYENDSQKSMEEFQKIDEENKKLFSEFKFLKSKRLHDLFFRVDIGEPKSVRIRNLKFLDVLQLDEVEDYIKFVNGDIKIINRFRILWHLEIVKKFNDIISSLDDEIKNTNDELILLELQSIKDILKDVLKGSEEELLKRNTVNDILEYWPTLLLPRSIIFDIS